MRLIVTAKLVLLTAIIVPPVYSHVLMPWSYEQREAAARLIVIAESVRSNDELGDSDTIEFKVLTTLKGQPKSVVRVSRSTAIAEERLTCCEKAGRYILFLIRGRGGLYVSVHGNYGAVQLAE